MSRPQEHHRIVNEAIESLDGLLSRLRVDLERSQRVPNDASLENRVSETLGHIHSAAENAMNDYRVNRKVAKVERRWLAEFEKQEAK